MLRRRLFFLLKLVLSAGTLSALVYYVDAEAGWEAARRANPLSVGMALALLPLNLWTEVVRWRRLVGLAVPAVTLPQAAGSLLAGYALAFVTPMRLGDIAGRVLALPYRPRSQIALLSAAESVLTQHACLVGGLAGLAALLVTPYLDGLVWQLLLAGAALWTAILTLLILTPHRLHARFGARIRIGWLRRMLEVLRSFSIHEALVLLALSLLKYLVFWTQFVVLLRAFAPEASVALAGAVAAMVFLVKTLVPGVLLADLGIREAAAVYFTGLVGLGAAVGLNAALVLFAINIVLPTLIGVPFLLRLPGAGQLTNNERLNTAEKGAKSVEGAG